MFILQERVSSHEEKAERTVEVNADVIPFQVRLLYES